MAVEIRDITFFMEHLRSQPSPGDDPFIADFLAHDAPSTDPRNS